MASRETIHSGHFMASNVHENRGEEEEEIDVVSDGRFPDPEVMPDAKDEKPVTFYKFGPQTTRSIAIDTSLLKLNRCIQTAYAQLITPKWKNFKGLKLVWKERIRLNNVIWRAWHAQFVRRTEPKFCHFSVPEEDWHNQTEAAGVMEGIYWKRRMGTVCAQYKRWRQFYYKRSPKFGGRRVRSTSMRHSNSDEDALILPLPSLTPLSGLDDDDWNNWFTDTLFSSLGQPYLFPNPKEMAQAGNADFIQPGLVQLQPSLEEIMASLENDGPLSGSGDPALSLVSAGSDLDRMNGSVSDDPSLDSLRNGPNLYTTKDYAVASLLVEYSNSSQAGCSSSSFGNQGMKMASSLQRREFRMPPRPNIADRQLYDVSPRDLNNGGSLCDPYVPQLATIETNTVQYTLAKTWQGDNGNGRPTMATAGGYDYGNEDPLEPNGAYSPMATTIQLLKSDQVMPRAPAPSNRRGKGGAEISVDQSLPPKRVRQVTRKPMEKKDSKGKVMRLSEASTRGQLSVASTAPTVVGIIGSGDRNRPIQPAPPSSTVSSRKGSGTGSGASTSTSRKSSGDGGVSTTSSGRRSSASSMPDIKQPNLLTLATFDYSKTPGGDISTTNILQESLAAGAEMNQSPNLCTMSPLVIQPYQQQQQLGVVRPIPISLAARTDSAFSAISPSGFSPPSNMSQSPKQQRSPGTSTTPSSLDFSKPLIGGNDLNATTTLVTVGPQPQLVYGGANGQAMQSTAQAPVLILQPFGGMQIPIMALPYPNSGASFATAVPKQEPLPLNSYETESYSSSANGNLTTSSGQRRNGNVQQLNQQVSVAPPMTRKAAKRPADSTLDPSERKRVQHLHAEQSRRSALKNGFELLEDLLPEFSSTNTKPTNALVLLKSAERLRELKTTLPNNDLTIARLKTEIQQMNEKIGNYQKQLTVSGKSASKIGMFQQMLENYIKQRTQQSWKFWLMKKVLDPLIESYKNEVQGTNRDELLQSAFQWSRKRCTKEELRPVVNNLLVQLGVETPLMKSPALFRQYVQDQINK